jgi:cell wall-associated NlpC family hydrolase
MDNKYIGIPYKLHGRASTGCDCYGLVYLYLADHGYTLPKYDFSYTLEQAEHEITVERALLLGERIDTPEECAIVLLYMGEYPVHMGVYTENGILHASSTKDSIFEPIYARSLQRFTKMEFYSVSKSYCTT